MINKSGNSKIFLNFFFFLFYTLIVRGRDEAKILCLGGIVRTKKKSQVNNKNLYIYIYI